MKAIVLSAAVAAVFAVVPTARAAYVISGTNSEGVTTDALDVAQGGSATASSAFSNPCCGTSDPNEAIGLTTAGFVENSHFIFADGVGGTDVLDIHAGSTFTLRSYDIILQNDGPGNTYRGATSFSILAGSSLGTLAVVDSGSLGNGDYSTLPGSGGNARIDIHGSGISISNVNYVELQLTRASAGGPRVVEVDGFSTPEPGSLALVGIGGLGLLSRRRRI